jgi:phosphoglycolate phosphatase
VREGIQAILFDFDYTLADSSRAVIECVNMAFEAMVLPPVSEEAVRRTIGTSLPDTLARLAGEEHRPRAEEFRAHFRKRSDEIMVAWTEVYPSVGETVASLHRMGFRLGIVSTKFRHRIQDTLQREGLLDRFDIIVGGEDVAHFKPDPQGLLLAAERAGSRPEQVLYVGDSLTDAETARRAQARFLAVLSGMTAREEFDGYRPEGFLAHVGELPGFLEGNAGRD